MSADFAQTPNAKAMKNRGGYTGSLEDAEEHVKQFPGFDGRLNHGAQTAHV